MGKDVDEIEILLRAHAAIEQLAELTASAAKDKRHAWVKPALAALLTLIGTVFGAGMATARVWADIPKKGDITALEKQYAAKNDSDLEKETRQNERIAALELGCNAANTCCDKQSGRLDRLTRPDRLGPY